MNKRSRDDQGDFREAVELLCCRPATAEEQSSGASLTPLERQVVALKRSVPPHVVLMVACGYRVKFYGRDSRVISRRTGIMCIPGQPFEYSSIPYTRVDVYIHRLVEMGYHVGFADQESAAVRAVEGSKSGIFTRTISQLYSRGTLLPGERVHTNGDTSSEAAAAGSSPEDAGGEAEAEGDAMGGFGPTSAITAAAESMLLFLDTRDTGAREGSKVLQAVLVSFVTHRRIVMELELSNTLGVEDVLHRYDIAELILISSSNTASSSPVALLGALPQNIGSLLRRMLPLHMGPTATGQEDKENVSVSYYTRKPSESTDEAIAAYLVPYKMDSMYKRLLEDAACPNSNEEDAHKSARGQKGFAAVRKVGMLLPGSTLRALEVFRSSAGDSQSLFHLVNRTTTSAGARELRQWLSAPLLDYEDIMQRQRAVTFLVAGGDGGLVQELLAEAGRGGSGRDLEVIAGKVRAQRCTVREFIQLARAMRSLSSLAAQIEVEAREGAPPVLIASCVEAIHSKAVETWLAANRKLLESPAQSPLELFTSGALGTRPVPSSVQAHMNDAAEAERRLDAELQSVRQQLGLPTLEYRTIAGTPFVVDVPHSKESKAGTDWIVLTRTKSNVRFHTPEIVAANTSLCAARERMAGACRDAWCEFQEDFYTHGEEMPAILEAIHATAFLDALFSLATLSRRQGYVPPTLFAFSATTPAGEGSECALEITQGRHPVIDEILHHHYVACDVRLGAGHVCLLTGPNMGGKSAFMRMIGTLAVLAQIGCYVPAESARIPLYDGVFCRMGASDSVLEGRSTFLSEMEETSRILAHPSLHRSLVLMDELGRGTSSFDGVAVASATLEYLLQRRANAIFVTHYTDLCAPYWPPRPPSAATSSPEMEQRRRVECFFMGFSEEASSLGADEEEQRIVFTYRPCRGVAPSSFGVQVAKMAGLPQRVTEEAALQSRQAETLHELTNDLKEIARLYSALK